MKNLFQCLKVHCKLNQRHWKSASDVFCVVLLFAKHFQHVHCQYVGCFEAQVLWFTDVCCVLSSCPVFSHCVLCSLIMFCVLPLCPVFSHCVLCSLKCCILSPCPAFFHYVLYSLIMFCVLLPCPVFSHCVLCSLTMSSIIIILCSLTMLFISHYILHSLINQWGAQQGRAPTPVWQAASCVPWVSSSLCPTSSAACLVPPTSPPLSPAPHPTQPVSVSVTRLSA